VRKHGAALPQLQQKMDGAVSSLSVPFTTASHTFDKAVRVPGHKAEEYLTSHPELFDNRVADVVVIDVPAADKAGPESLRAQDMFVGRISNLVSQATKGNYAALLTGASASNARRLEETRRRLEAGESTTPIAITRDLATAIAVMVLIVTAFMSGFCCLFSLQTPKKFNEEPKAHTS